MCKWVGVKYVYDRWCTWRRWGGISPPLPNEIRIKEVRRWCVGTEHTAHLRHASLHVVCARCSWLHIISFNQLQVRDDEDWPPHTASCHGGYVCWRCIQFLMHVVP